MKVSLSQQRMIENQVVFRTYNKRVQKRIDELNEVAREDGATPVTLSDDTVFSFCCECSDENCKRRLNLSIAKYNEIHTRNDTFTIAPEHDVPSIEDVTFTCPDYWVVKKRAKPPRRATTLQKTPVKNV